MERSAISSARCKVLEEYENIFYSAEIEWVWLFLKREKNGSLL